MAHSIVIWLNTPDTWAITEQEFISFEVKHIIKSSDKMRTLSNIDGIDEWVDLGITGTPTAAQFIELGMDSIEDITKEQWAQLERPIEVLTWTDDEEARSVDIDTEYEGILPPRVELTVPEYTIVDDLEKPLKLLTYTDGVEVPKVKTEFDMVGVGTRIMKRGE